MSIIDRGYRETATGPAIPLVKGSIKWGTAIPQEKWHCIKHNLNHGQKYKSCYHE
jgi:hypothetical protein